MGLTTPKTEAVGKLRESQVIPAPARKEAWSLGLLHGRSFRSFRRFSQSVSKAKENRTLAWH